MFAEYVDFKVGRLSNYEKVKETYTSVTFVCGVELYVCVYLVYILQLIAQNNNFLQKLIQNLNLQIQHKKPTGIKSTEKKMDNFHILQPKNKENRKHIQEY